MYECRSCDIFEKVEGLPEMLLCLSRKAHDYVYSEKYLAGSKGTAYEFEFGCEGCRVISASHLEQYFVTSALEGNMEMGQEFGSVRKPQHHFFSEQVGFN